MTIQALFHPQTIEHSYALEWKPTPVPPSGSLYTSAWSPTRALGQLPFATAPISAVPLPEAAIRSAGDSWTAAESGRQFHRARRDLIEYLALESNWNGYGSAPIRAEAVGFGLYALSVLLRRVLADEVVPREVTPSPISDGGIALEVAVADRVLILTAFPGLAQIGVFKESNGKVVETDVDPRALDLDEIATWLIGADSRATNLV